MRQAQAAVNDAERKHRMPTGHAAHSTLCGEGNLGGHVLGLLIINVRTNRLLKIAGFARASPFLATAGGHFLAGILGGEGFLSRATGGSSASQSVPSACDACGGAASPPSLAWSVWSTSGASSLRCTGFSETEDATGSVCNASESEHAAGSVCVSVCKLLMATRRRKAAWITVAAAVSSIAAFVPTSSVSCSSNTS